jgi:hypothetical protein
MGNLSGAVIDSLPNTKAGKNLPQQIIAGELPGNTGQAVVRQAQFFRE